MSVIEPSQPEPVQVTEPPGMASQLAAPRSRGWIFDLLLVVVLLIGIYLRFIGVNWDENRHLHPDERFLTMVETGITPVQTLGEYFDTANSTLNPNNRGYGFFVYGTLPIFIVRYVAEWLGQTGYDQVHLVGRQLSAVADLLTVFLVYLIALRLYNRRVGLLAAALAAFSVLPIQLSHFFTVDTFTNCFGFLAVYSAVIILTRREPEVRTSTWYRRWLAALWPYLLFGLAIGLAAASKINAVVLAVLLPLAAGIRLYQLPKIERQRQLLVLLVKLAAAGVIFLVTFRIFQPYAFTGPGFFDIKPNQHWIDTMVELNNQTTGDVDFPPALQWARRPITFAWTNMVEWGMGLPLGLLAWAGFLWMGWRIYKKDWSRHFLLWSWTGVYFAWQSWSWTRSMRYQMLVYPTLAIIAAWAVNELWERGRSPKSGRVRRLLSLWRPLALVLGIGVTVATLAWAFAFTRIYARPMTRVEASRWIYQNVPGPLNLKIQTSNGEYNQPLPFHSGSTILPAKPFIQAFKPGLDGILTDVDLAHVADQQNSADLKTLHLTIAQADRPDQELASSTLTVSYAQEGDVRGKEYMLQLNAPLPLRQDATYLLQLEEAAGEAPLMVTGPIVLGVTTAGGSVKVSLPAPVEALRANAPFNSTFAAFASGSLKAIDIPWMVDQTAASGTRTIRLTVTSAEGTDAPTAATATLQSDFPLGNENRGRSYHFVFDQPLALKEKQLYSLSLELVDGQGAIAIYGSAPALESSWDDALPQPVDGYSPYDFFNGLYQGDLNFEMYWDDNADKLTRFETTLDQADHLFISSNRQWGTTVRVPERYPLTTAYYRNLLGCPDGKDIIWCYAVAKPGMFTGKLGYELEAVFQSDPNLGPISFNDQFAEEAFTVYDHPKVLIFKKTAAYNSQQVRALLGAVDLSQVVHLTPRKAGDPIFGGLFAPKQTKTPSTNLMLPPDRLAEERSGGTWSALFNRDALQNKYEILGVVLWYLIVTLLGLLTYPLVRLAMPGLADRGYPLARTAGLLLLAYFVWIGGSLNIPVTRTMITLIFAGITLVSLLLALRQWPDLKAEFRQKKRYFLVVEGLALAFFVAFLLVRLGNPDLWHPYKGGEKPMDFSYLNAVIKSTTFPPYDPWFAGGYINYYYYGFVIVGVLIKWLGIIPSFAYNLFLPMLYSMLALGAFSIGWNLTQAAWKNRRKASSLSRASPPPDPSLLPPAPADLVDHPSPTGLSESLENHQLTGMPEAVADPQPVNGDLSSGIFGRAFWVGLSSAVGLQVLGNLGTVRMIWQGFQRMAAPGSIDNAPILTRWIWSFQGFIQFISGKSLPYPMGDWYWIPSRAIPGEPITEFPLFTFLYADPHAHLIALPVTVLALAWTVSIVLGRARWGEADGRNRWLSFGSSLFLGAMVIGALWPTNTWDFPTYLTLGVVALVYVLWRYFKPQRGWLGLPINLWRSLATIGSVGILVALSRLLYQPFFQWFGQAYNSIGPWNGDHTPFWSYTTHWGLFLFVIASWMAWETYHWMATTPMSSLARLRPYQGLILGGVVALVGVIAFLEFVQKVSIAWLVLLMAVWALVLILRPDQPDSKRLVLFLTGTALVLTLAVELVVLQGDIGRMNTVFKFYLQAWTLFAISAAAGLGWLLEGLPSWSGGLRTSWQVALGALIAGAALFTILGSADKIRDRMAMDAPHTLDGMTYMAYAQYNDQGNDLNLNEDYLAIRWMQDHVQGSPVIIEGNVPEYRWGTRFTIYTGLPGVVGWNWHQRQQRALLPPETVTDRVADVGTFYTTTDQQEAETFLKKYNIQYVIVGQMEQADFPGPGLAKFPQLVGVLWNPVYQNGQTTIYEVIP